MAIKIDLKDIESCKAGVEMKRTLNKGKELVRYNLNRLLWGSQNVVTKATLYGQCRTVLVVCASEYVR